MLKITIPTPCHEDWTKMTATQQGRHCNACAKTVVDFTAMSDNEVKKYLGKTAGKICGRFTAVQLQRIRINVPGNIFYIPMPLWKRFLVASLLIFGSTLFSCDASIEPPAVSSKVQPLSPIQSIAANAVFPKQCYVGMLAISDTTPVPAVNVYYPPPDDIKGDIAMVPDTAIVVEMPPQQGFTTGEISMPVIVEDTTNCNNKKFY